MIRISSSWGDFARNFYVMNDHNNGLIRIRNPDRENVIDQ